MHNLHKLKLSSHVNILPKMPSKKLYVENSIFWFFLITGSVTRISVEEDSSHLVLQARYKSWRIHITPASLSDCSRL